jgi:hypothetical protein
MYGSAFGAYTRLVPFEEPLSPPRITNTFPKAVQIVVTGPSPILKETPILSRNERHFTPMDVAVVDPFQTIPSGR